MVAGNFRCGWLLAALALTPAPAVAQAIRVEATVNANRIGVQDVLQLTVSISGDANSQAGNPQLPALDGFTVAGQSTSSQFQIVNGRTSATRSIIYQLRPQREGTFRIGAITVEHQGQAYETKPIDVEVVAGSVAPPRSRRSDPFGMFGRSPRARRQRQPARELTEEDVFVQATISKASPFLGEGVVLTYRLFTTVAIMGLEIDEEPSLTGFWVEDVELPRDQEAEQRTVGGKDYYSLPIKQQVLFPTKSGKIELSPALFSMAVRTSSGDPFDSFFMRSSEPIQRATAGIELNVRSLPGEGRPRDYQGAVGQYQLDATLNTDEVAAGDPVTLTLSLQGTGNLRTVDVPELPPLSGFRIFDPKTDERLRATNRGLRGTKQWEYVLVPETGGLKEIGPWSFPYFDPEKGRYLTATAGPLNLRVSGDVVTGTASASTPRGEVQVLRQDIRFLKEAPATLGATREPFYQSPWFYWSLLLPLVWNLGFVVYLRRQEKERTHSHVFRSRRAHRMARNRLKHAAKLAKAGSKEFYEEVAAALYRFVADKATVSASGLTTQSIDAILTERGVSGDTRQELLAILNTCEEARFTPGERTPDEMEALRSRAESVIVATTKHLG